MKQNAVIRTLLMDLTEKLRRTQNKGATAEQRAAKTTTRQASQPARVWQGPEVQPRGEAGSRYRDQHDFGRLSDRPNLPGPAGQNKTTLGPQTNVATASTQDRARKLSRAEITKMNHSAFNKVVPTQLLDKTANLGQIMVHENFKPLVRPTTIAVYFSKVRRGLVGRIRKALRECPPSWTTLRLGFVGSLVLEVVMDGKVKDRTVATLKMIVIMEINDFDILGRSSMTPRVGDNQRDQKVKMLGMAVYRLRKNIDNARNKSATE